MYTHFVGIRHGPLSGVCVCVCVCVCVTIIACCSRELLKKMHYFIHLNLAITLCLAYILFLVGGPTAIAIRVSHVVVGKGSILRNTLPVCIVFSAFDYRSDVCRNP